MYNFGSVNTSDSDYTFLSVRPLPIFPPPQLLFASVSHAAFQPNALVNLRVSRYSCRQWLHCYTRELWWTGGVI